MNTPPPTPTHKVTLAPHTHTHTHTHTCHSAGPTAGNLYEWTACIKGPPNTPYEGGKFLLQLKFPASYPFSPPKVTFRTRIYHCNINSQGLVCMSVLRDEWTPALSVATLLVSLSTLLANPNPGNSFNPLTHYSHTPPPHTHTHTQTTLWWVVLLSNIAVISKLTMKLLNYGLKDMPDDAYQILSLFRNSSVLCFLISFIC